MKWDIPSIHTWPVELSLLMGVWEGPIRLTHCTVPCVALQTPHKTLLQVSDISLHTLVGPFVLFDQLCGQKQQGPGEHQPE